MPTNIKERERIFAFTITPFKCSSITCPSGNFNEEAEEVEEESEVQQDSCVQTTRRSTVHVTACEEEMEQNLNPIDEAPVPIPILETVNGGGVSDCVIGQENFVEPPNRKSSNSIVLLCDHSVFMFTKILIYWRFQTYFLMG